MTSYKTTIHRNKKKNRINNISCHRVTVAYTWSMMIMAEASTCVCKTSSNIAMFRMIQDTSQFIINLKMCSRMYYCLKGISILQNGIMLIVSFDSFQEMTCRMNDKFDL